MFRNIVLLAFFRTVSALNFNGTGEVRTLSSANDVGSDLGCLTDAGMWTKNDTLCGTFTGYRDADSTSFTISSTEGPCTLDGLYFECGEDIDSLTFWAWSGLITGYDVLAYGESVTFSSPMNASETLRPVRTYHTSDPKPWIHLGWFAF
ncbi:hypothetical protein TruAng_011725 [Truncatella angustata]|nr:hypothetical protein TruAng_011725 [Truncatella angustata]